MPPAKQKHALVIGDPDISAVVPAWQEQFEAQQRTGQYAQSPRDYRTSDGSRGRRRQTTT